MTEIRAAWRPCCRRRCGRGPKRVGLVWGCLFFLLVVFLCFFVGGGRCFAGGFGGKGRELGGAGAFSFLLAGVFGVFPWQIID